MQDLITYKCECDVTIQYPFKNDVTNYKAMIFDKISTLLANILT